MGVYITTDKQQQWAHLEVRSQLRFMLYPRSILFSRFSKCCVQSCNLTSKPLICALKGYHSRWQWLDASRMDYHLYIPSTTWMYTLTCRFPISCNASWSFSFTCFSSSSFASNTAWLLALKCLSASWCCCSKFLTISSWLSRSWNCCAVMICAWQYT